MTQLHEKETDILRAICDYLSLQKKVKGYLFWRANNIGMFDGKDFRPLPKYSMLGVPDINLIWKGIYYGLEVKTKIGVQSENQKTFQKECELVKGKYFVVRSVDDVIKLGL